MNRKEAARQYRQAEVLKSLGFTSEEAEALRRISMTLHRWYELECGDSYGAIERDERNGKPFMRAATGKAYPIADRESGALNRLRKLIDKRNDRELMHGSDPIDVRNPPLMRYYIQTDPRGAALYILRPGDVPEGKDADAYYTNGICVY